jgi:predicted ester cyclase
VKNFDSEFKDLPDYIIKITEEIWENRGLDTLRRYYGSNLPVRTPYGLTQGNEGVIAATMATLAEFPDRQLLGEDVIWSGNEDDGFLSSHRIFSTATHLGNGVFGKATGKKLGFRIIADCYCIDNQITDEWMIRDLGAIASQLGYDAEDFALKQMQHEGGIEEAATPFTPEEDIVGPYTGKGNDNEVGQRYVSILQRMMNAEFSCIEKEYDRGVQLDIPGGRSEHGHQAADRFWLGLRSAFPNAQFSIDHVIGRQDAGQADRAAVRWSLWGKHEGAGLFGAPTNAQVFVMGISHAEFGPRGLNREWVLFDEIAIWKQILKHKG